jgi:hypothetical protein
MEFIIISGMSGAGKSKAASFMEDMNFFCVDNLPAPLIVKFAELGMAGQNEYDRVVLVTDVRGGKRFDGLFAALDELKKLGCPYRILFMDAEDEIIDLQGYDAITDRDGTPQIRGGVCNIGSRPTVNSDENDVTLETYIFDYSGDLYDLPVRTSFCEKLRDERKFASVEELAEQIARDSEHALQSLAGRF